MSRSDRPLHRRVSAARLPLTGLVFLVLLMGMLVAAVVDYQGGFTARTRVVLYVPDAGSQLAQGAQVKLRGSVVGTVDRIQPSDRGARLTLALDPDRTDLIPADTVARILPKTLVGQDYVDLVVPAGSQARPVVEGSEIRRDTSTTAATLEGALDKLLDVLQVLPPQQVSSTLNALSSALEGRGETLGQTLVSLQSYLERLNPALPTLADDLRGLQQLSRTYVDAAPDLLQALDDLSVTARTVTEQRTELADLLATVTVAGDDLRGFLARNRDNLIELVDVSRPTLTTLARYAPEYPCLLDQLAGLVPRIDAIFGKGDARPALNITLVVTNSRGKYKPNQDEPSYDDDRGPRCYEVVRIAPQYPADGPIEDGSVPPPAPDPAANTANRSAAGQQPGTSGTPRAGVTPRTGLPRNGLPRTEVPRSGLPGAQLPAALPGSDAEADLIAALLGQEPDRGSFAPLLMGPVLRGSEVSLR